MDAPLTLCGECRQVNSGKTCSDCGGRCLPMPVSAPRPAHPLYGYPPAAPQAASGPLVMPNI